MYLCIYVKNAVISYYSIAFRVYMFYFSGPTCVSCGPSPELKNHGGAT